MTLALLVLLYRSAGLAQIKAYHAGDSLAWLRAVEARGALADGIYDAAGEEGRLWLRSGA